MPTVQGSPVLTEPWTAMAGSRAIVRIGYDVLITDDHGKSWRLERLSKGEALTLGQSGIMYRAQYDILRGGYHFTATYDGVTTTIAVLPADQLDLDLAALDGMCERRGGSTVRLCGVMDQVDHFLSDLVGAIRE
jgi:hypothetical protein